MSLYEEISRRNTLSNIFLLFDSNSSGFVDVSGFERLVNCLMVLHSGTREQDPHQVRANTRQIAGRVVAHACDRIELLEFLNAAMTDPCPFDCVRYGTGLSHTLLHFFDVANYPLLDEMFPFVPTYEYQNIEAFQSIPRNCESIMSVCNNKRMAKISDPLQVKLAISDGNYVRVWLNRHDTPDIICHKVVENWPGLRGRNFHPPVPADLQLEKSGCVVDPSETSESMRLFFDDSDLIVRIIHPYDDQIGSSHARHSKQAEVLSHPHPPTGASHCTQSHRSHMPHHPRHEYREKDHTFPSVPDPPSPMPIPSSTNQYTSTPPVGSDPSADNVSDDLEIDKDTSVAESQRLCDRFSDIRQDVYIEAKQLRQKVQSWQDRLTVERDLIPCRGEMYEPYREDLRQQARALSDNISGLESALLAILE